MVKIFINNKEYKANEGDNVLKACLSLGFDIPYFCWHPVLGSVGACRQCAVKLYKNMEDLHGQIVMSCMTPIVKGTCIKIDEEEVNTFRKGVMECLMINHPHDCPVCEEGGNCHLQDMAVMVGHTFRRYRFTKRTHLNQNLGPFIAHEMNRCIACYRCVRYYKDYADGQDLNVYGAHDNVYFGRLCDGALESEFSGNLVEICPTGVFTDKTCSKRFSRKWDMQFSPSICQQCSLGCNISLGERHGELRRIDNRYHGAINHYFLCDRGRFGYGYVNLKNRPHHPVFRHGDDCVVLGATEAIKRAAKFFKQSKKIIGIGSPRASIESNFALRELVGKENFSMGLSEDEKNRLQLILKILLKSGIYIPTLREIESYDAILILGEDLTQTAARAALAVRQAVKGKSREMAEDQHILDWQISAVMNVGQNAKYPLFITNVDNTRLDDVASLIYLAPVEDQARLGFAIAHELDEAAVGVDGLDFDTKNKVDIIVQALIRAKKPLIISGIHSGSIEVIQSASNIAKALKKRGANVGITMIADVVNSVGLGMIGGNALEFVFEEIESGSADGIIVIENDLYRHASAIHIDAMLSKAKFLMVIDHQRTMLMKQAHIALSASSFAESDGTVVNNEGRAQRFFRVYDPTFYNSDFVMLESWRWLYCLRNFIELAEEDWGKLDNMINAVVKEFPQLAGVKDAAPDANFRIFGQKLARKPNRYSGRTAMCANINIHEPRQPLDEDTMFVFSMEGHHQAHAPCSQIPFAWAPGWNSFQAWNKFQDEIGGHLRNGDPGVRLINTDRSDLDYFTSVPNCFESKKNSWRIAPYYHLFGSDELSQYSPLINSYMLQPYIKLNPEDAFKLGVHEGSILVFQYEGQVMRLPLVFSKNLAVGQVGLPMGMSGISPIMAGMCLDNLQKE